MIIRRNGQSRAAAVLRSVVFVATLLGAPRSAMAQASHAGILLTLPTSTRSLGLGDATVASISDEWSLFASPAQLAKATRFGAAVASEAYIASTQLSAAAVTFPAWRGTIGIGATMLDYGSVKEIVAPAVGVDGAETGRNVSAQDVAFEIGYARTLPWIAGLRSGITVEMMRTSVADLSADGVAASLGVAWTSHRGWDLAAAYQHVGTTMKLGATSGSLPEIWRVGVAAPVQHFQRATLRPMAELRGVRGDLSATAAAELLWPGVRGAEFVARAGYTVRDGSDDRWPVALGAGVVMGRFSVDYAMERFRRIDQVTHRIGIRFARAAPAGASTNR